MLLQAPRVRPELDVRDVGQVFEDHDAVLEVGRKRLPMVVHAGVVVEKETLHAHEPVELDPLSEVVRLVLVDRADREVSLR